jgi:Putative Ig domain
MLIGAKTISFSHTLLLLGIVVVGMILAGIVVIVSRAQVGGGTSSADSGGSVIRSWIAISLVMGLLIFCAAAFLVEESSLRSTLFGGLIASVSAAVAFYFSSKSADQARSDILKAAVAMSQGSVAPTGFVAASPGAGKIGEQYFYEFGANGVPAPEYVLASGNPPPGVVLSTNGKLEGKPTTAGEYKFSVRATNVAGSYTTPELSITIA